jgi:hypothetical protein
LEQLQKAWLAEYETAITEGTDKLEVNLRGQNWRAISTSDCLLETIHRLGGTLAV